MWEFIDCKTNSRWSSKIHSKSICSNPQIISQDIDSVHLLLKCSKLSRIFFHWSLMHSTPSAMLLDTKWTGTNLCFCPQNQNLLWRVANSWKDGLRFRSRTSSSYNLSIASRSKYGLNAWQQMYLEALSTILPFMSAWADWWREWIYIGEEPVRESHRKKYNLIVNCTNLVVLSNARQIKPLICKNREIQMCLLWTGW